jgi:hypothetical protein
MNKRQLKYQMKELREKQEKNIAELGKLQARQDIEDEKLSKENAAKKSKLTKQQEVEEAVRTWWVSGVCVSRARVRARVRRC